MNGFVSKQTDFGDKDNIFDKVFCQKLTDGTNEVNISDLGSSGAPNWKTNKDYKANSLVYINDKLYICTEEHTSGADFATDLLSGKWKFIGNGVGSNVVTKDLINNKYTIASVGSTTDIAVEDISDYDYLIVSASLGSITLERTIKNKGETHESKDYDIEYTNVYGSSYFIIRFNISNKSTIKVKLLTRSNNWSSYPIVVNSIVGIKIQELTTDYIANLAMPSDVMEQHIINIKNTSWGNEISDFSVPEDGYVSITGNLVASSFAVSKQIFFGKIINGEFLAASWVQIAANGVQNNGGIGGYYEVKKGERVAVRSNGIGIFVNNKVTVRFFYSVGSAKALGLID